MNSKIAALAVAVIALLGVGAFALNGDSDSEDTSTSTSNNTSVEATTGLDELTIDNLAPLEAGLYEGWVVQGDDKLSFGTFNTDEDGNVIGELSLDGITAQDGDTVAISIEPVPDDDPEPSPVIVLAGIIEDGSAELAFPLDVASFSGGYITGTPTNDPTGLENSGVWFVDPTDGPSASLNIPDAPEGWVYEGWVVYEGTPYTTGRFASANAGDDFNDFSGTTGTTPNFPGEDFVNNLPDGSDYWDLANGTSTVVVSIEPDIDGVDPTGDGPAQLKPLSHLISEDIVDHTLTDLELDSSVPSGSFSL